MNRRCFIQTTSLSASMLAGTLWPAALAAGKPSWPIGCFNRAWTNWSYDDALDGIAAAGYRLTGLLSTHRGEAFTASTATPDYLDRLKRRIARRGLTVNMTALRFQSEAALADNLADVRKQIENAARLELQFLLTFGVDGPEHYDDYYRLMADAAAQAEKRGLKLVLKPHGGVCTTGADLQRCLEKVGHANFKLWFDAGNIIYYSGRDPVAELEPLARHVTGFCAKDCSGPKGEVMSRFGSGKVDFKAVFAQLKAAGFSGPIMVEGVKVGASAAGTTANARTNREFLERVLGTI